MLYFINDSLIFLVLNTLMYYQFVCIYFFKFSMSVDWRQQRGFESPRGQICFFNDVPWQNNAVNIIYFLVFVFLTPQPQCSQDKDCLFNERCCYSKCARKNLCQAAQREAPAPNPLPGVLTIDQKPPGWVSSSQAKEQHFFWAGNTFKLYRNWKQKYSHCLKVTSFLSWK